MEELRKIAQAHYLGGPDDVRISADEFMAAMDEDGDEYITWAEFSSFLEQNGHAKLASSNLFRLLDIEGRGRLNSMDVMALYYIMKSGRPFCNGSNCGNFIAGAYFACIQCFPNPNGFCLCIECFQNKRHAHDPSHRFLDNFTLLQVESQAALPPSPHQVASSSNVIVPYQASSNSNAIVTYQEVNYNHETTQGTSSAGGNSSSGSLAIVPKPNGSKREKMKVALKMLDKTVQYAFIAAGVSNACAIL